jgi:hypothetical protein
VISAVDSDNIMNMKLAVVDHHMPLGNAVKKLQQISME